MHPKCEAGGLCHHTAPFLSRMTEATGQLTKPASPQDYNLCAPILGSRWPSSGARPHSMGLPGLPAAFCSVLCPGPAPLVKLIMLFSPGICPPKWTMEYRETGGPRQTRVLSMANRIGSQPFFLLSALLMNGGAPRRSETWGCILS